MEVTCHLPGPFQSEGLNFSSWRAPQEAPWLAVLSLWPRSSSLWPLLTRWSPLLASSTKLPQPYNIYNNTPIHCRGNVWNMTMNTEVMENPCHQGQGYTPLFFLLSGSRFLCDNSNLIIDNFDKLTTNSAKISWHYIFNVKINNPKEYI